MNFRLLLCVAVLVGGISAQNDTTAAPAADTTTTKMAETTTTMAADTTTTKMAAVTTTTKMADTTTTKMAAVTTTTKMAETTTTMMETTTMAQTTMNPKDMNMFTVTNENGTVCLILTAEMFNVTAICPDMKPYMMEVQSKDSTTTGTCGATEDMMEIEMKDSFKISMTFEAKDTYYMMTNVTVDVTHAKCMEMANQGGLQELRAPKNNVYRCNAQKSIDVNENITLTMSGVKFQAFRMVNTTALSGQEYICMEDSTVSNVVPIAVGCALAGLIIIVLIAYIIGRLRRRPYEPV